MIASLVSASAWLHERRGQASADLFDPGGHSMPMAVPPTEIMSRARESLFFKVPPGCRREDDTRGPRRCERASSLAISIGSWKGLV